MGSSHVYHIIKKLVFFFFFILLIACGIYTYTREGSIVPQVALVGEAVADVSQLALFGVLFDRVEEFLFGDLRIMISTFLPSRPKKKKKKKKKKKENNLLLGIGPAGNLNNHVEHGLLVIGIERDIVEGRDGRSILFDIDSVLDGVGLANLTHRVFRRHDFFPPCR